MNRQYSLFSSPTSKAKARREKFASAKQSLSASWEQTFPENATFAALPSPTIGEESGIPERLSLVLNPLAKGKGEQSHNQPTRMVPSPAFFPSSFASSSNNSGVPAKKALSTHLPDKYYVKPQPKWSPRLQIARQSSQPVLKTAEIVDITPGKAVIMTASSSTSCTNTAASPIPKRSLAKHNSESSSEACKGVSPKHYIPSQVSNPIKIHVFSFIREKWPGTGQL